MNDLRSEAGALSPAAARAWPVEATRRGATVLLTLSLFFEKLDKNAYLGGRISVPDISFVVAGVAFAAAMVGTGSLQRLLRRPTSPSERWLVTLVAALGAISIAALAVGPLGSAFATQVVKTFLHLAFLLAVALTMARALDPGLRRIALLTYLACATAAAVVAIAEAVDVNALSTGISNDLGLGTRAYHGFLAPLSIYSEPAYLGYATLQALLIAFFLRRSVHPLVLASSVLVCVAALVLSASAGAIILGLVLAVVVFAMERRHVDRRIAVPAAAAVVVCAAVAIASPAGGVISSRLTSIWSGQDPSAQYRRTIDEAAVHIWRRAPFTGVGLGNSRVFLPEYVHLWFEPNFSAQFVDSSAYLGLLAETGPVGLALFVATLLALARPLRRRGPAEGATRAMVMLAALECLIVGGFVRPTFWFTAGLRSSVEADEQEPQVHGALRAARRANLRATAAVAVAIVAAAAGEAVWRIRSEAAPVVAHRGSAARIHVRASQHLAPTSVAATQLEQRQPEALWELRQADGTPIGKTPIGKTWGKYAFGSVAGSTDLGPGPFLSLDGGGFSAPTVGVFPGRRPFSLVAWVRPRSLTGYPRIFSTEPPAGSGPSGFALLYEGPDKALGFLRLTGAQAPTALASVRVPTNRWSFVAATYDGTTLRIYVDGRLAGAKRSVGALRRTATPVTIGSGASWSWDGWITDAAVYSRALSPATIAQLTKLP